ncbi:M61 family metallopeptidase [Streptomyces sp. NPDC001840]
MLEPKLDGPRSGINVSYNLAGVNFPSDSVVCRLPRTIVGVPGAEITGLRITDDRGPVHFTEEVGESNSSFTYRNWAIARATSGDVRVEYFAPVRAVDAGTANGPLFDLRFESVGIDGAGITFLALPETTLEHDITLRWALSRVPATTRAVSSLGEGTVVTTAKLERLTSSFYMAGQVSSWPESDAPRSAVMYWLTAPSFDTAAVARHVDRIYGAMSDLFADREPGYRVFVRKHPYQGDGGTGFWRSFAFGYGPDQAPTVDSLSALLAHETAHTWPRMDGRHGETAWYSEGTAEYYSLIVPYRKGIIPAEEFLRLLNEKIREYCTNPLHTLSNDAAEQLFWTDSRAQRIPYGRGLIYLLNVNAQLLAHSGGTRCLDDLVLEVLNRHRTGVTVDVQDWVDLVVRELGEQGRTDFEAMVSGDELIPRPDALGEDFVRTEAGTRGTDLRFEFASLKPQQLSGPVAESAQAAD